MGTAPTKVKTGGASRHTRNNGRVRELKRHPAPWGREERHLGAREDQVGVTLPPKADDDEPKQG